MDRFLEHTLGSPHNNWNKQKIPYEKKIEHGWNSNRTTGGERKKEEEKGIRK